MKLYSVAGTIEVPKDVSKDDILEFIYKAVENLDPNIIKEMGR